jgi:hypothetical protein
VYKALDKQGALLKTLVDDYLLTWLEAFMIDRKAQRVSEGTLHFYEVKSYLLSDSVRLYKSHLKPYVNISCG